jgi:chitin synthase
MTNYDDCKSFRSDEYDGHSRLTSHYNDDMSNFGTDSESYAPSRNMFQNQDKARLMDKEAVPGEMQDGQTSKVLKESSGDSAMSRIPKHNTTTSRTIHA